MAKHKVVHSEDACTIVIKDNPRDPEPSHAIIKFPGGNVEVSRCKDGTYWAHLTAQTQPEIAGGPTHRISESRVDYASPHHIKNGIPDIPDAEHIQHLAIRVTKEAAS